VIDAMVDTELPLVKEPEHDARTVQDNSTTSSDRSSDALPVGNLGDKATVDGAVGNQTMESTSSSVEYAYSINIANTSESKVEDKSTHNLTSPTRQDLTPLQKVGTVNACIILASLATIVAVLAFLLFLWFANSTNTTWLNLISRNWLTKAVSISADVLKHTSSLQIGISGAILAALSLESHQVLLPDAAAVSIQRTGKSATAVPKLLRVLLRIGKHSHQPISLILVLGGFLSLSLSLTMPIPVILLSSVKGYFSTVGKPLYLMLASSALHQNSKVYLVSWYHVCGSPLFSYLRLAPIDSI
jgi:hypothetical protein